MSPEQFEQYISNLIEMDLVDPDALLILFGGEYLNHPRSVEIFRIAMRAKGPGMRIVIITSGKYLKQFIGQVDELIGEKEGVNHWEVSVKDFESFQFGLRLLKEGHKVLFRYDYLDIRDLRRCLNLFFQHVRLAGLWKTFLRHNPKLVKGLKDSYKAASQYKDSVIVEEFYYPVGNGEPASVGLIFSYLDRSVMRIRSSKAEANCSVFHPVYQKAIHLCNDGTIYPCHLPRYKKRCQALGNAADTSFLKTYREKMDQFKEDLSAFLGKKGLCTDGCRGKISYET